MGVTVLRHPTRAEHPPTAGLPSPRQRRKMGCALPILALCFAVFGAKAHAEPTAAARPSAGGVVAGKPRGEAKKKVTAPAAAVRKPLPPRRKSPAEPKDETAPVQSEPPKARLLPAPAPPDTSMPPPRLPPASREKMRACAVEWAKLKLETHGPLPLWRDFAGECLTRVKTRANP